VVKKCLVFELQVFLPVGLFFGTEEVQQQQQQKQQQHQQHRRKWVFLL
jgi:hypothetical protein